MLRVFSQIPTMHHLGKWLSTTQGYGRDEDSERDISKMSALNTPESPCRKPLQKRHKGIISLLNNLETGMIGPNLK